MALVTDSQIARVIVNAGATGNTVATMVAIALAESGGRSDALGDVSLETATWGPSVGLWQIRSLKSEYGTGGVRDQKANLDPQTNATHAMSILHSQGLSAWSTYNSGAYRMFLARGNAAAGNPANTVPTGGNTNVNPVGTGPLGPLGGLLGNVAVGEFLQLWVDFFKVTGTWFNRAALVLFGVILIVAGGVLLARGSA